MIFLLLLQMLIYITIFIMREAASFYSCHILEAVLKKTINYVRQFKKGQKLMQQNQRTFFAYQNIITNFSTAELVILTLFFKPQQVCQRCLYVTLYMEKGIGTSLKLRNIFNTDFHFKFPVEAVLSCFSIALL